MINSSEEIFQKAMNTECIDKETFIRLWNGDKKPFRHASSDLKGKTMEMIRKAAGINV